jgi:hypothetical protein
MKNLGTSHAAHRRSLSYDQVAQFSPNGAPLLKNEPHFVSKRQL